MRESILLDCGPPSIEENTANPSTNAPSPSRSRPGLKVCLIALAKSRDERFDSAQDMADDMHRYLRGTASSQPWPKRWSGSR